MKKYIILLLAGMLFQSFLSAQERILFYQQDRVLYDAPITEVDSIKLIDETAIYHDFFGITSIAFSEIDSISFTTEKAVVDENLISITFRKDTVWITNPYADQGVDISTAQGHVSISDTVIGRNTLTYYVSGITEDGSLTFDCADSIRIVLNNANLSNPNGSLINITQAVFSTICSSGYISYLSDGEGSGKNASILSKGSLLFDGAAQLAVSGLKKHAISSDQSIYVRGGIIKIPAAVSDGFHCEAFVMEGGSLAITAEGDAIDAGGGSATINGGNIKITSTATDVKGIKSDALLSVNGGTLELTISGAQSKGFSSKSDVVFNGGNTTVLLSGAAVLEPLDNGYDPSYCTAVKSKGKIIVNDGQLRIEGSATNDGGKGLSADGDLEIHNGNIQIFMAGSGATYTNESGEKDSYTSCCIKSDKNVSLFGGVINCSNSGQGGKGIAADECLILGQEGIADSLLIVDVVTSGERFYVSGSGDNADYANPKAVKSDGNLTVYSGIIRIACTQSDEGGEGLESKDTLSIHGGDIDIETYDDCINASNHIAISGGKIHCVARGNDAIDANGTISISGGLILAYGDRAPEGGIDCDQSRFVITGGVIVAAGGSNSTPTTSACTQASVSCSATPGSSIAIMDSEDNIVLLLELPTYTSSSGNTGGPGGPGNSTQMSLLFSDPALVNGSYTLKTGGSISGGSSEHGYNRGGSYSGGSSKSFSISSMMTTIR